MHVFISWSGISSRTVADTLSRWLEHVVSGVDTFLSTQDIDAGERWETIISAELDASNYAVLCVTKENQTAPWLLYEAGALGKLIGRAKVVPYTIGFTPQDLAIGPLSRFQGVASDEAGTWDLVRSMNHSLSTPKDEGFLREAFELWWPKLESSIRKALTGSNSNAHAHAPSERALLLELRKDMNQVVEYVRQSQLSEVRKQQEMIDVLTRDPLTKLANRRTLDIRMAELQAASIDFVIACVDIDGLKRVNDAQGHVGGDQLISVTAATLSEVVSSENLVARLGGDEFVVLFTDTSLSDIAEVLQKFVDLLPEALQAEGMMSATASVGVSRPGRSDRNAMLESAMSKVIIAKREGGNRVVVSD